MRVDFEQTIKDIDGKEISEDGKNLTLKFVCVNSLMASFKDENPTGVEKLKRYNLAMKIHKGGVQGDVSAEEITTLKERIGKMYSTLVVGQAYEMLDPQKPGA